MPHHIALTLMNQLKYKMGVEDTTQKVPFHLKFISALNFYGSGSYQRRVGMDAMASISQSSISRIINEVSKAIVEHIMPIQLRFHQDQGQMNRAKDGFLTKSKFPNVIGLIDGTHIDLSGLSKNNEYAFVNRKGNKSINTQIICDSNMVILNVNARYPGSTHDSFIWSNSLVFTFLENLYQQNSSDWNKWLLGDSGYPLQPWLLTPIKTPTTDAERKYNKFHKKCRCLVEQCIGCLKGRFRCLLGERKLRYNPTAAGYIIYACATLHNYLINNMYDVTQDINIPPLENVANIAERMEHNYLQAGTNSRTSAVNYINNL